MNRFVSLLLVGLSLAAVTLAQPAQAQQGQWYRGLPYFLNSNSGSSTSGTTVTATINNPDTGHLNITAAPINASPGYSTSGSYGGSVGVYYVWYGGNPTQSMTLQTPLSLESTGAGGYGTSGNSNADGQRAYGDFSTYPSGWDSPASAPGVTRSFAAGATPASQNLVVGLGGSVSAYYNSYNPGQSIVTADVTFSAPVVTH